MEQVEKWKDIPEYKGKYQVSNFGRVKSLRKGVCDKNKKPLLTIEDIQLYIKELEEENKRLKENQSGFTLEEYTKILNDYQELQQRIDKAIEYIEEYYPTSTIYYQDEKYKLIKILKGE